MRDATGGTMQAHAKQGDGEKQHKKFLFIYVTTMVFSS